ncbi:MAG: hypothetical protein WBX25_13365 [Rhodomicrobium sp.]
MDELAAIAHHDIADFLDHDGSTLTVKSLSDLPRSKTRCIQEIIQIDTASGPALKIKFYDKLVALDKLAKMAGYYPREANINLHQNFVLRAPAVEPSTKKWLETHGNLNNRKQIELQPVPVEPEGAPVAPPPAAAAPIAQQAQDAWPEPLPEPQKPLPEPRGLRLDGTRPRGRPPRRID